MSATRRGTKPTNQNTRNPSNKTYNKPDSIRPIPIRGKTSKIPPKLITPIARVFLAFKVFTGLSMKYEEIML